MLQRADLGSVVIDTSSSSPFGTRELGTELGKPAIDQSIHQLLRSTSMPSIDTAGATLMVGSDSPSAIEKAMPVLKKMSKFTCAIGRLWLGHAMKTLSNYVSVGSIIALCDALVASQKLGLDPQTIIVILSMGTGRNFSKAYSM